MAQRKIIEIDRDLCNGCGVCTSACAEGALALDGDNKAVLLKEIYCDGLGACLAVCPTGALKVVDREVPEYDSQASYRHVLQTRGKEAAGRVHGHTDKPPQAGHVVCGCPGSTARDIPRSARPEPASGGNLSVRSELGQWPIQLRLVSPLAPYFNECDLLVAADCTAFSLGSFHRDLLRGKKLVIACPKLDDTTPYVEKLADILKHNTVHSLTVAVMTVPCCLGLVRMVDRAVELSGSGIKAKRIVIDIDGTIKRAAA